MNLAVILGLCLLSAGWLHPVLRGPVPQTAGQPPATASSGSSQNQGASASQTQAAPSQSAQPAQPSSSPTGQPPNSAAPVKPAPAHPHHKKTIPPNCSNAPTAMNPTVGNPGDPANSMGPGSTTGGSNDVGSTTARSSNAGSTTAESRNANSGALKPCPPPKKVVRNGGSSEPQVQLTGGTAADQASQKSSTDQLRAATEENLKKVEERQLSPTQREMVSQIKEFMEQSKAAVAAGDLERGHNLALKAHLLSDELVKP